VNTQNHLTLPFPVSALRQVIGVRCRWCADAGAEWGKTEK